MTSPPESLLITGAAGFIGSCFAGQCAVRGVRMVVLDKLTYAGNRENLAHLPPGSYEFVQGDIADFPLVSGLLRKHDVSAIVNFAAESHVDNSIAGPGAFVETNILGTYRLLEAARSHAAAHSGFRFVQVSTDEVYGSLGPEGRFDEQSPYRPNSPYSASKAAADHLARAWHHTFGLDVVTTQCTNNYGPRQHAEKLIPRMIACALGGKPLPVYGDGKNVRDWIHVEDHSEGVWLALTKGRAGEVYGFGGDAERDNLTLVRALCAELDALHPREGGVPHANAITLVPDRPGHDRRYAIDSAKAARELGWKRRHTLESGLRATVEWYLEQFQSGDAP